MERFKRVLSWILVNGVMLGLLVYGKLWHAAWAWNIAVFSIPVFLFISLITYGVLVAGVPVEKKREIVLAMRSNMGVPLWMDHLFDVGVICFLVAFSHWFLGVMWLIQLFMVISCHDKADILWKQIKKEEAAGK